MSGLGVINFGHDLHFEETLIASGRQDAAFSPYGGVRAMQAVFGPSLNPIASYSVSKSPTVGAFAGMTVGDFRVSLRPEIAVYYGQADIHAHGAQWVVIPSFTLTRRSRLSRDYSGCAPY